MTEKEFLRFAGRTRREGECWIWTGAKWFNKSKMPYGLAWVNGKPKPAHRVAYEYFVGPIPDGLTIDHVAKRGCRSTLCVSPAHLEPVTLRTNILRSETSAAAVNARKTHCIRGHFFDNKNTLIRKDGSRFCRACARMRDKIRRRQA